MCETHRFYIFLANACLPVGRGPNKIRHIGFQQEFDFHPWEEPYPFALKVGCLEKGIEGSNQTSGVGVGQSLAFFPSISPPPLSSSPLLSLR